MATDRSTARVARVVAPWTASYDPALKVARGERVTEGRGDPDHPGWRWCVNADGLGGWLPEALVADGCVLADFDTTELTVAEGEEVEVLGHRAGWSFCRGPGGARGWVPDGCLRPLG